MRDLKPFMLSGLSQAPDGWDYEEMSPLDRLLYNYSLQRFSVSALGLPQDSVGRVGRTAGVSWWGEQVRWLPLEGTSLA